MKYSEKRMIENLTLQNNAPQKQAGVFPILAIDYGQKYTGIAYSPDGIVVIPLAVVLTNHLTDRIKQLTEEKKIKKIVVGLPLEKDGNENPLSQEIRSFFKETGTDMGIEFVNERFSSQNIAISTQKGKPRIDDLAAAQILEFYLRTK